MRSERIRPLLPATAALLAAVLGASPAAAALTATTTLTDTARGWYTDSGDHTASIENYLAGWLGLGRRNFFVFDLTGVPGSILSAKLRLELPSVGSFATDATSETYELHQVTTAPGTLDLDATGQTAIYNDLGDGPVFGSVVVDAGDMGTILEIDLNEAGVQALRDAAGGLYAIGGLVTTIDGVASQFVFGNTPGGQVVELVVETQSSNDFKCYKAKDLKFPAAFAPLSGVTLEDLHGSDPAVSVTKLASVCTPVDRDGRGIYDASEYRCCYKIKAAALPTAATMQTGDDFGPLGVSYQKAQTLCVPCTATPTP